MSVKERILAALAKGDAQDREFRETVYRQVFAALEKSVKTNSELSADDVYRRREQIVAIIEEIEKDFAAAEVQPEPMVAASPSLDFQPEPTISEHTLSGPEADFVPSISHEERVAPQSRRERARARKAEALLREEGGDRRKKSKRRIPWWLRLILWLVVLGFLAWGGLWLWKEAEEAVRTGGASIEEIIGNNGTPLIGGNGPLLPSRDDGEWVEVFNPSDTSTVRANNGSQTSTDEQGNFLSIGGNRAVTFTVDPGTLQQFAGRTATFSVRARAAEGETQIAVTCDFGAMGKCNRLRYAVGATTADYLFDVDLANVTASGGTISIVPDVEGKDRNLDVFSITVTAE